MRYSLAVALEIVRRVEVLLAASRQRNEWFDERLLADAGEMRRGLRCLSGAGFLAPTAWPLPPVRTANDSPDDEDDHVDDDDDAAHAHQPEARNGGVISPRRG